MCLNGDYGRCFTFAFVFVAKCSGDSRDVVRRSNEGGQELLFLFGLSLRSCLNASTRTFVLIKCEFGAD